MSTPDLTDPVVRERLREIHQLRVDNLHMLHRQGSFTRRSAETIKDSEAMLAALDLIERQQEIIDQLSKTRDGQPITPKSTLWYIHPKSGNIYQWDGTPCSGVATSHRDAQGQVWVHDTDCYSTEEAARAAKEVSDE